MTMARMVKDEVSRLFQLLIGNESNKVLCHPPMVQFETL